MKTKLIGKKVGMTRVFSEDGKSIPVTVIEVQPNYVTQIKTEENDGYKAIQVTTGKRKASRVTKPQAGHFAKAKVEAGRGLWEIRVKDGEIDVEVGSILPLDAFQVGQKVDVTSTTKGKGFAGTIKRHNFAMQDATHGNSRSHRVPGSIGQNQTPGRVFKGKKMCGQMGSVQRTAMNLDVVKVDSDRNFILIRGAVPGAPGTDVIIRQAVKAKVNATA